jgi:hypothetical protein
MNHRNQDTTLDDVLAEYASAAEGFDAKVLQELVDRYPDHAPALHRYAQVQLASVRADQGEIAAEALSATEMPALQHRLREKMGSLATKKLEGISGEQGLRAAATAVFGACQHGEDMLLMLIKDSGIRDVPGWVFDRLAKYVDLPMSMIRQALPLQAHAQSYKGKPTKSAPVSWAEAVAACIADEETRRALLDDSRP